MVRFARGVCLLVAVAWVVSCGGGGGTPTTPSNTTPPPPAVTLGSVTVTAPAPAAKVGDSAQFTATAVMSNSTTQTVTTQSSWQSSNTAVATVTANGMVAAVGAGEADIRATYQSVTGLAHVVVTAVTSSSFSLCGTIRGASNAPLSGAEAEIRTGVDAGKRTSTDSSGNYCLTAVRPGTFSVRGSKADYNLVDQNVTVSGNTTLNFTLAPIANPNPSPTPDPTSFSLCGTIRVATTNAALSGAEAEIRAGANAGKKTTTDNSGSYCLTAVQPGTFTVRASKTDYTLVDQSVTVSGNTTLNFTLAPTPTPTPPPDPMPVNMICNAAAYPSSASCGTPSAVCNDNTLSCSQNRQGTCSSHDGVKCWLCPGGLCNGGQSISQPYYSSVPLPWDNKR